MIYKNIIIRIAYPAAYADHRMAMVFGAAGVLSQGVVKIEGGEAVGKSYPRFWEDLESVLCAK